MKLYRYVGPEDIRLRAMTGPMGARIESALDLADWLRRTGQQPNAAGLVPVTFVIDDQGSLRTADRASEHVACAGGGPVLSAGEMFLRMSESGPEVAEVTNQSTGFCPEPESWPAVAAALDRSGIRHPGRFTQEIIFRRCPACRQRNIVKDRWFVCGACGAGLPETWNFADGSSGLVPFYRGQAPDSAGRLLTELWGLSDDELELTHDVIQWLFPLPEPSRFNPDAPLLTAEDIAAFHQDERLRDNLMRSFRRILPFLGLALAESGEVVQGPNFQARMPDVWAFPNHNWLRITRVLRSLNLLGLEKHARALYGRLDAMYRGWRFPIREDTFRYWTDAVRQ